MKATVSYAILGFRGTTMAIKIKGYICWLSIYGTLQAAPSFEVIQSCKNNNPANKYVTMTEVERIGYSIDSEPNCKNQFDTEINGKIYGSATCEDKPYLIIADHKVKLESANNYSTNPSIKPTTAIAQVAGWWKIVDSKKQTYLCIESPLSNTGTASNAYQYFIVADPFNEKKSNYEVSFYFFEKKD